MIIILLPVHNQILTARKFVNSLLKQTATDFRLVLIDDGSTDGTAEMVLRDLPETVVIKGTGDWWWGGSLHQGYRWIMNQSDLNERDIILIINVDTELGADFLENGRFFLNHNPRTLLQAQAKSLQTGKLVDIGTVIEWNNFLFRSPYQGESIDCLSTRGLFIRVGDFSAIGGFHPVLLPHYGADYEFTIRAKRKGFKLMTIPAVWLWMDESITGIHDRRAGLRKVFSKKSSINPWYLLVLIIMSCPLKYQIPAIYRGIIKKSWPRRRRVDPDRQGGAVI